MPKTKISEFSATPGNNTDIDGINIAEGCAPSGINDAIRELMAQLKDFQAGTAGDSFNGPVGTSTAAAGAFTTLSASSTVSGAGFSTYLASPPAIGGTAAAAGSFTTLTTSSTVTLNAGVANGVAYLNGSKVLTTGSALTFDGTGLGIGTTTIPAGRKLVIDSGSIRLSSDSQIEWGGSTVGLYGNGSTNSLHFFANTAEQMRLTSTGLGIGTSSPARKLNVVSGSPQIRISDGTAGSYWDLQSVFANTNQDLLFSNQNGTALTINSSGNLGLGVTPSAWGSGVKALDIGTSTAFINLGDQTRYYNNAYLDSALTARYKTTAAASGYITAGGVHSWYTAPSGTAGNAISFTQAMTLDASGNWMNGTTTAIGRATVVGGTSQLAFHDGNGSNTNYGLLNYGGSSGELTLNANSTGGNTLIRFLTSSSGSNAERARITSGGNLLVGTTVDSGPRVAIHALSPVIRLQETASGGDKRLELSVVGAEAIIAANQSAQSLVFQTVGTERARITSGGDLLVGTSNSSSTVGSGFKVLSPVAGHWDPAVVTSGNSASYSCWDIYSTSAGAYRFYVTTTGVINATSTTITAISDQRLKENVRDIDTGLDAVLALKPRRFDWKEGKGQDKKNAAGFIAQEFETVFPNSVGTSKAGEDGIEYKNICHEELIPTLVKAIQEQQAIITALTSRVAALEAA